MRKTINKCVTPIGYREKTLLVSSGADGGVYLCSFTTVIGAPVAK